MSHVAFPWTSRWRSLVDAPVPSEPTVSARGDLAFTEMQPGRGSRVLVNGLPVSETTSEVGAAEEWQGDHLPRWSPSGERVAFVRSRSTDEVVFVGQAGRGRPTRASVDAWWRIEDITWSDEATVTLLVAPRSSDSAVADGALRGAASGPCTRRRDTTRRRLMRLRVTDGMSELLDTSDVTIWELAAPARTGAAAAGIVAVVSDDPTESGWYRSRLSLIGPDGHERVLHRPDWQIARPRVSPDGDQVVVVAGWSSDRGHVAGGAVVVDLVDGSSAAWHLPSVDAVSFEWIDDSTLHVAGWRGTSSVDGLVDRGGSVVSIEAHDLVLRDVTCTRSAPLLSAATAHRAGAAPCIATRSGAGSWQPAGNGPSAEVVGLRVEDLTWEASDGLVIEGLLVTRDDLVGATCSPVVLIHGGPANLWTRAASVGAAALAEAGYAVIMPNPRGSVGRGQGFAQANLGDPGGRELTDVLAGASACRRRGRVRDVAPGLVGGSYGGFLTAAAAVSGEPVSAAVVMYGHPDLISARFGSNNSAFYDILLGGPPTGSVIDLYVARSPVLHAHPKVAPTLVLHGEDDRCTPVGQADELFRALLDQGVTTELVTYPGQGHGLRRDGCEADVWTRTIAWFDEHISRSQVGT